MNLGSLAIGGVIIGFWQQFRSIIYNIFSLAIRSVILEYYEYNSKVFMKKIIKDSKIIRLGDKIFNEVQLFNKEKEFFAQYFVSMPRTSIFLYKNKVPIFVSFEAKAIKLKFLWKTFNYEKLFEEVYAENENRLTSIIKEKDEKPPGENVFYVDTITFSDIEPDPSIPQKTGESASGNLGGGDHLTVYSSMFDDYYKLVDSPHLDSTKFSAFNSNGEKENPCIYYTSQHIELKRQIEFWLRNKRWFAQRGLDSKRSSILYGPPGCGKSKAVYEIARELKIPVKSFSLAGATNKSFKQKLRAYAYECIILFEDIDAEWNQRENMTGASMLKDKLSFDFFLNCLSGVDSIKNCFTIFTTNHIEKLDPALIRDGRCDVKLEFGPIETEGRRFIAKKILYDWPDIIDKFVEDTKGMVAAEVENRAIKIAIDKKWKELDEKV